MSNKSAFKNYRFAPELTSQLNNLSKSDDWHSLVGLTIDFGIIAFCIWVTSYCYYLYPLSVLIIGARQRGLATIMHDAAHSRGAQSKWLNAIIGRYFTAYLIFQSFDAYKLSHVKSHHYYLGNAEKDPDFQFFLDAGLYKLKNRKSFFLRHVLSTLLMINAPHYAFYLMKHRLGSLTRFKKEAASMLIYWCIIVGITYWVDAISSIILFWMIPYLTTFMVIGRFIVCVQRNHLPINF